MRTLGRSVRAADLRICARNRSARSSVPASARFVARIRMARARCMPARCTCARRGGTRGPSAPHLYVRTHTPCAFAVRTRACGLCACTHTCAGGYSALPGVCCAWVACPVFARVRVCARAACAGICRTHVSRSCASWATCVLACKRVRVVCARARTCRARLYTCADHAGARARALPESRSALAFACTRFVAGVRVRVGLTSACPSDGRCWVTPPAPACTKKQGFAYDKSHGGGGGRENSSFGLK